MRGFQTWLIMQVMVARGAACQVTSELPVCPDCTVYTSHPDEQDNKGHLKQPKPAVPTWFSGYRCHNTELGTCISQRQGKWQVWPQKIGIVSEALATIWQSSCLLQWTLHQPTVTCKWLRAVIWPKLLIKLTPSRLLRFWNYICLFYVKTKFRNGIVLKNV